MFFVPCGTGRKSDAGIARLLCLWLLLRLGLGLSTLFLVLLGVRLVSAAVFFVGMTILLITMPVMLTMPATVISVKDLGIVKTMALATDHHQSDDSHPDKQVAQ